MMLAVSSDSEVAAEEDSLVSCDAEDELSAGSVIVSVARAVCPACCCHAEPGALVDVCDPWP